MEDRGTARKYLSSVEWLQAAKMATLAECVNEALPGLAGYVKEEWFNLYMSDVGLLASFFGLLAKRELLAGTLKGRAKRRGSRAHLCRPSELIQATSREARGMA